MLFFSKKGQITPNWDPKTPKIAVQKKYGADKLLSKNSCKSDFLT